MSDKWVKNVEREIQDNVGRQILLKTRSLYNEFQGFDLG